MAFTPEQETLILDTLKERGVTVGRCQQCNREEYHVVTQGFTYLALQETTRALDMAAPGMPCVAILCDNCGHTRFFNMLTLGLPGLVNPEPGGDWLRRALR